MASPTPYTRSYSFSDYQANNPSQPLPGPQVDNELENIEQSLGEAIDAINDVRRADGALPNGKVTLDSLADEVRVEIGEGALASAAAAAASAVASASSATAAGLSATAADGSADAAATSATAAQGSANQSAAARNAAQNARDDAIVMKNGADTARDFAAQWASAPVDTVVDDEVNPPNKSAYHWAKVAEDAAAGVIPNGAVTEPKLAPAVAEKLNGALQAANNLDDVNDAEIARANLGVYASVAELEASTRAPGGAGARWQAGSFLYDEAASGATDADLVTASGVGLYLQPLGKTIYIQASAAPDRAQHNDPEAPDGAITAGTKNFSAASADFSSVNISDKIAVSGAGAAGTTLFTTIAGIDGPTAVTLADAAGTTVAGARWISGPDAYDYLYRLFSKSASAGFDTRLDGRFLVTQPLEITMENHWRLYGDGAICGYIAGSIDSAVLKIDGAGLYRPTIEDINLFGVASAVGSLTGLHLEDCANAWLGGVMSHGHALSGIRVKRGLGFTFIEKKFDVRGNKHSGVMVQATASPRVLNGHVEGNGIIGTAAGYGLTFNVRDYIGGEPNNTDVICEGNLCIKSKRKGIDVHNGVGVRIAKNRVLDNASMQDPSSPSAIYAVGESLTKYVQNVEIIDNEIDLTGASSIARSIEVGAGKDGSAVAPAPGYIVVERNESTEAPGGDIFCYVSPDVAAQIDVLDISGNIINSPSQTTGSAIFVSNGSTVPVKNLRASYNKIKRSGNQAPIRAENHGLLFEAIGNVIDVGAVTAPYGIVSLSSGKSTIDQNKLIGTFTNLFSAPSWGSGNTINGALVISKGFKSTGGSTLYSGEKRFEMARGSVDNALDIVTVDCNVADSAVAIYLEVLEVGRTNTVQTLYSGYAAARQTSGAFSDIVRTVDTTKTIAGTGATAPALTWENISGTKATLRLTAKTANTRIAIRAVVGNYMAPFTFL